MNDRLFELKTKYHTHEELTDYLRDKEFLSVEVNSFLNMNMTMYKAKIVSLKTHFILSEAVSEDYHMSIDNVLETYFNNYETKMVV